MTDTQQTLTDNSHAARLSTSFAADDENSAADLEDWLRQNVVIQYWKGKCETRPNAVCRLSNIAVDWFVLQVCNSRLTVGSLCVIVGSLHVTVGSLHVIAGSLHVTVGSLCVIVGSLCRLTACNSRLTV